MDQTIPLLVLVGPTASGKTALALALSSHLTGTREMEVVSADSRQIYRLMDIATAKPTAGERARLPHHLLDVVWPDESYTLAQYQEDAQAAIAAIHGRGALPVLVGGTGLYVRAVVDGLAIPRVPPNPALRARLEAEAAAYGPATLVRQLAERDPVAAERIDSTNVRRIIRALEVCIESGRPFSEQQGARPTPYRTLMLGLNATRDLLYARADARVDAMLAAGLVEETRMLVERGYDWSLPSMSSLGYREIGMYLRGEMTLADAVERLKFNTHSYIRRQLTWFRPDARIHWLDAAQPPEALLAGALALARPWLAGESQGGVRS